MVLKLHGVRLILTRQQRLDLRASLRMPGQLAPSVVAVVLMEKGVPFEFVPVTVMKSEEYKANMQPFGQIPVLEDNGYFLYESRAMGRYVAQKYANEGTPDLIPTSGDLKEMGNFEKAMSIEATQFLPAEQLVSEVVFKAYKGGTTDPAEVTRLNKELAAKMDAYDQILGNSKYLAGDHITLADLYHLPYADMVTNALKNDVMTTRPNVARWLEDISSRPAWVAVKAGVNSTA